MYHAIKLFLLFGSLWSFRMQSMEMTEPVTPTKIAYLSWGSLAANPGSLPLVEPFSSMPRQGPVLPVEYARQMSDGRLTLVITPGFGKRGKEPIVKEFKTFYATFKGDTIGQARSALQAREGVSSDNIGYIDLEKNNYRRKDYNPQTGKSSVVEGTIGDDFYSSNEILKNIGNWAKDTGYTGVIWTDLPPTFTKKNLTLDTLKNHLDGLERDDLKRAYCYFTITPEIRNETSMGNALRTHAGDRLQNFFGETLEEMNLPSCINILYLNR